MLSALDVQSYVDLNKNELRNARVQNLGTAPSSPVEGQIYYDTVGHQLLWWNGTAWTLATGTTTSFGTATTMTVGQAAVDGVATSVSRSDHKHAFAAFGAVSAQTSFGAASGDGSATTIAHSDHTHGTPTAPSASSVGAVANATGTPSIYADIFANRPAFGTTGRLFIDQTNNIVYRDTGAAWVQLYAFDASASTQAVGDSAAAGTAVTVSRGDHKHAMPAFNSVTAQTSYGAASGNGSAATIARSDHTHGTVSLSANAASTQAFGDTATNGSGTAPAKDDHKHAMPALANPSSSTTFGQALSNGSATTAARSDHLHGTPAHDASAHSAISISNLSAATGTYSFGANLVQSSAAPVGANDLANKTYVDSVAAGLRDFKDSVRVATTGAGTLATSFANGQVVDGVTLATGDRILIKNQAAGAENGIYTVAVSGAPTRSVDMDANSELSAGTMVYVESGTAQAAQQWICSATGASPWVVGSSTSTWVMYFAVTSTQAGAGLTASANVLAVGAGTGISVGVDSVGIDTTVVARKYIAGTGPGSSGTTWAIAHNLGNRDVAVQVYDATTYAVVNCDTVLTDTNTVTLTFGSTITLNTLRAVVVG